MPRGKEPGPGECLLDSWSCNRKQTETRLRWEKGSVGTSCVKLSTRRGTVAYETERWDIRAPEMEENLGLHGWEESGRYKVMEEPGR